MKENLNNKEGHLTPRQEASKALQAMGIGYETESLLRQSQSRVYAQEQYPNEEGDPPSPMGAL